MRKWICGSRVIGKKVCGEWDGFGSARMSPDGLAVYTADETFAGSGYGGQLIIATLTAFA